MDVKRKRLTVRTAHEPPRCWACVSVWRYYGVTAPPRQTDAVGEAACAYWGRTAPTLAHCRRTPCPSSFSVMTRPRATDTTPATPLPPNWPATSTSMTPTWRSLTAGVAGTNDLDLRFSSARFGFLAPFSQTRPMFPRSSYGTWPSNWRSLTSTCWPAIGSAKLLVRAHDIVGKKSSRHRGHPNCPMAHDIVGMAWLLP